MSKQTFVVGTEIITASNDPSVDVTFDPTLPALPPGPHVFQLIVEDETGNRSAPAAVTVNVVTVLTAVITAPPQVNFTQGFTIDGSKSVVQGAAIKAFHWTLLK
jgi:hypothetical protein